MTYEEIAEYYRTQMGVQKESSIKILAENSRFRHRKKGDHLLVAGDDMTTVIFHLNGVGRSYTLDSHGRECIMGFCRGVGACLGASGIQEKVSFNIDAVTDMDIIELPVSVLTHLMKKDPDITDIYHQLLIVDHDADYQWHIAIQTKKGAERYQWFLEEHADLVGVVTQKDIASYLNLKPQSLSRIKLGLNQGTES